MYHTLRMRIHDPRSVRRGEVEAFIRDCFRSEFQAEVREFYPQLLCLHAQDERIQSALGVRYAAMERIFLEDYLDAPIEAYLSKLEGAEVTRESIVEIGNFCTSVVGGKRSLIIALTAYLYGKDYRWVVYTVSPLLMKSITRIGIQVFPIAQAERQRLAASPSDWGCYYESRPVVAASKVAQGFDVLKHRLLVEHTLHDYCSLWLRGYFTGLKSVA